MRKLVKHYKPNHKNQQQQPPMSLTTSNAKAFPTDEGGSVSMGGGSKEQKLKWEAIEGIDTLGFASV